MNTVRRPLHVRFWPKVDRRDPDECWPWRAGLSSTGYGAIRDEGQRLITAHRASLILDGRDPGPLVGRHTCNNRVCVNPAHLIVGTSAENAADALAAGEYRGERNAHHRLTDVKVRQIRELLAGGETQRAVSALVGISQSVVSTIHTGQRWAHVA